MKRIILLISLFVSCVFIPSVAQEPYTMNLKGRTATLTLPQVRKYFVPEIMDALNRRCPLPIKVDGDTAIISAINLRNDTIHAYERIDITADAMPQTVIDMIAKTRAQIVLAEIIRYMVANPDVMPKNEWKRLIKELELPFKLTFVDSQGVTMGYSQSNTAGIVF